MTIRDRDTPEPATLGSPSPDREQPRAIAGTSRRRDSLPRVGRPEITVIGVLTGAFLAILMLWSLLTPAFGAPDEAPHLNSAIRLTGEWSWPAPGDAHLTNAIIAARDAERTLPASERAAYSELVAAHPGENYRPDQMTQHPPLYYAGASAVLRVIGFEELRPDQSLLALRLVGVLFLVPLPLLVWDAVRRLTRSPKTAVVAGASVLGVPQLAFIGGSVTNDNLVVLLCSVVAWLSVRVMTGDARVRVLAGLASALGLALLTKGTALPFVPFALAVLLWWPRTASLRRRWIQSIGVGAVAFAIGGWWWLRNLLLYRDLQPSGLAPARETVPWEDGTGPDPISYLDGMWSRLTGSFWGRFGTMQYAMPELLTDVLAVAAIGMVVAYFCVRDVNRTRMLVLAALPVLILVMLTANTWRHYVRTQVVAGIQGRYFFVAIVVLIALSAVAWYRLVPPARRRLVGTIAVVCFVSVAAIGLFREYIGVYEVSNYRVSADGLADLRAYSIAGALPIAIVGVGVGALAAAAVYLVLRFLMRRTVEHAAAAAQFVR